MAELPFARDSLLAEARATLRPAPTAGSPTSGGDDFLEPLEVLLPALEHEAELTVIGRWMTRRFLLRFLEVRIQLVGLRAATTPTSSTRRSPSPGSSPVHRARARPSSTPCWRRTRLHGFPRVGSCCARYLATRAPTRRSFAADARIPLADRELRLPGQVAGELDAIHVYRGRMHKECLSAMSFAFRSEEFTARYHVPSYVDWYERCDMRPGLRRAPARPADPPATVAQPCTGC